MNADSALAAVAPLPGNEFSAKDFGCHLQGGTYKSLLNSLHTLAAQGRVQFTGRPLMWRRIK